MSYKDTDKQIKASLKKKGEVFELNQVVFNGSKPADILEKRRPLESKENWTLPYRLDNFYPVHVSLFRRAMNDYLQVLNKADIQIITDSSDMKKWLDETKKFVNNRYYGIKSWLFNYISTERQVDPNGILIPTINFDFPKRFDNGHNNAKESLKNGIPYFDKSNKTPIVDIIYLNYDKVHICTEDRIKVEVGQWVYKVEKDKDKDKDISKPFYIEADKTTFYLTIPQLKSTESDVKYYTYPYYSHDLGQTPYVSIGGTSMTEYDDDSIIEYNVSDYYGAIAYACYMIASMSDKQVVEARNNFPIKYRFQAKCTAGCNNGFDNSTGTPIKCGVCDGTGWSKDTNPFNDYVFDTGSFLDDSGKTLAQPVNYVVPPVESLKYISENFKEYNTFVANELCVTMEQNMTNQAADAKRYDLMNKVTLVTYIVDDVLRVSETILSFVERLLTAKDSTLIIKKPISWDIKNKSDLLYEISEAKKSGSPLFVIKELVRQLLMLELKDNKDAKFIVDFLMKKDKLITYGISDLKDARINYGDLITERETVIHDNGLQIILELLAKDVSIEKLESEFETEVNTYLSPVTNLTPKVDGL